MVACFQIGHLRSAGLPRRHLRCCSQPKSSVKWETSKRRQKTGPHVKVAFTFFEVVRFWRRFDILCDKFQPGPSLTQLPQDRASLEPIESAEPAVLPERSAKARVWNANRGTRNEIQWERCALPPLGGDSGRRRRKAIAPTYAKNRRRRSTQAVWRCHGKRNTLASDPTPNFPIGSTAADVSEGTEWLKAPSRRLLIAIVVPDVWVRCVFDSWRRRQPCVTIH